MPDYSRDQVDCMKTKVKLALHNIIGHPLMEIAYIFGLRRLGNWIHNNCFSVHDGLGGDWVLSSERLPKDGQRIIFAHKLADRKTWWVGPGWFDGETKSFYCWNTNPVEDKPIEPEYWMPMPPPPTEN